MLHSVALGSPTHLIVFMARVTQMNVTTLLVMCIGFKHVPVMARRTDRSARRMPW
jgi:hypothetical protein